MQIFIRWQQYRDKEFNLLLIQRWTSRLWSIHDYKVLRPWSSAVKSSQILNLLPVPLHQESHCRDLLFFRLRLSQRKVWFVQSRLITGFIKSQLPLNQSGMSIFSKFMEFRKYKLLRMSSVNLNFIHSRHFRCCWCFCMLLFYWRSGGVAKSSVNFVMGSRHPWSVNELVKIK